MKVWFDTEFIEDGRTIDLLSIGAIREDGATFYAECQEADHSKASDWVKLNVLPKLVGGSSSMPRIWIAGSFAKFCGEKPEIWAYYADYDWVALCQLYGTMMDLPKGWPMFCRDVKQLCVEVGNPKLPPQTGEHHALADARWTRDAWKFLQAHRAELDATNEVLEQAAVAAEKKSDDPKDYTDQPEDYEYWRGYAKGREDAGTEIRTLKRSQPHSSRT